MRAGNLLTVLSVTSSFFAAWLGGEPRATALLPDSFRRPSDRAKAVAHAAARPMDTEAMRAIAAQNARFVPSAERTKNLELLARAGTAAVLTGQQVGLFLGPLFTVYKAATAIAAARQLFQETGTPVVPIFWLQTEDHDLPEVDHCFIPGPSKLSLAFADAQTSRAPVAHRILGPSITPALAALRESLAGLPSAEEPLALLERCYRPDATLADAFAHAIAELFADEGLIVINPRDPTLARRAASIHRAALEQAQPISDALITHGRALTKAGFAEQVHIRPGSPLSFVSPDDVNGARYRIDPTEKKDTWLLAGLPEKKTLTTAELLGWLEREPLRFTTSALLRPLVQDTLLPTAAYVGGPGELAYFAQLAPLYAHLNVPMPLIVLRSRFRVLEERTRNLLQKVGLSADEFCSGKLLLPPTGPLADLEARLTAPLAELARIRESVLAIDASLSKPLQRTEATIRRAAQRLATKVARALSQKDQTTTDRIEKLRAQLVPHGEPQERVYGLPYFAARFGTRAFVTLVLAACAPFTGQQGDLTP